MPSLTQIDRVEAARGGGVCLVKILSASEFNDMGRKSQIESAVKFAAMFELFRLCLGTFCSHLLHSPKPDARKPSTAPATRRAQAQASEAQARSTRQIVLGYSSWLLVSMEGRTRARPARNRGSVAPGRLQTVLDHALQSEKTSRWWSENFQADMRADLPDGRGESHLGCAAYPWRTAHVGLRSIRSHCVPLDEALTQRS